MNLSDSGLIVLHQTVTLLTNRYRPDQIFLQASRALNSILKWHIHRTAAWAIIHLSEKVPWHSTSKSFRYTTLTHVLNSLYSHAVASQLMTNPSMTAQTQSGPTERYDLDIWLGMEHAHMPFADPTPRGIHQRHIGRLSKQCHRFRFMSRLNPSIRVHLPCRHRHLHLLIYGSRAEQFVGRSHRCRHNLGGQEARLRLYRMSMGATVNVIYMKLCCIFGV